MAIATINSFVKVMATPLSPTTTFTSITGPRSGQRLATKRPAFAGLSVGSLRAGLALCAAAGSHHHGGAAQRRDDHERQGPRCQASAR